MKRERKNGAKDTRCPACGYDLVGLGDEGGRGVCPECGNEFDLKEIRARAERHRRGLELSASACRAIGLLMCVFCPPIQDYRNEHFNPHEGTELLLTGVTLLMLTIWMVKERTLWRVRGSWQLLLLALFVFRLTLGIYLGGDPRVHLGLSIAGVALLVHAAVWLRVSREWALLAVVGGLYLLVPGLFMALTIPETLGATHWSGWPDPRPGQVHRQYPLTQTEVGWVAGMLVMAGGVLVVGGYVLHRRGRVASKRAKGG